MYNAELRLIISQNLITLEANSKLPTLPYTTKTILMNKRRLLRGIVQANIPKAFPANVTATASLPKTSLGERIV
jgi:hypothetical protein